jgi:hypothetical protein
MNLLTINNLQFYFLGITKVFFIIGAIFYIIFALIVVKQVTSMSKSVVDKLNPLLITFSYIHLIFSIILFLTMLAL